MTGFRFFLGLFEVFPDGKMGDLGDMGLMGSKITKFISEQNKISSTLFKICSEQKFFISELFFCFIWMLLQSAGVIFAECVQNESVSC
ncbi:MAG: hypothetical protein IJT13_02385 [Bacteroidaceae bacterium]|nr:hypothetical protein [Bacteroidaceae bacterium]